MERSPEPEELSRRWIGSMVNGETAAFEQIRDSDDKVLFIGSDPQEWSCDALRRFPERSFQPLGARLPDDVFARVAVTALEAEDWLAILHLVG